MNEQNGAPVIVHSIYNHDYARVLCTSELMSSMPDAKYLTTALSESLTGHVTGVARSH